MNKVYITLGKNRNKIKDVVSENGMLAEQLAIEEPAELIQSVTKYDRITGFLAYKDFNRLLSDEEEWNKKEKWKFIEAEDALKSVNINMREEIADVLIAIEMLVEELDINQDEIVEWVEYKMNRMVNRAKEGELY